MTILKSNESLGSALYGVVLDLESMSKEVVKLSAKVEESKQLVERLRRLSDMIGTRFVDKFGDDELESIYAEWEALEMANVKWAPEKFPANTPRRCLNRDRIFQGIDL